MFHNIWYHNKITSTILTNVFNIIKQIIIKQKDPKQSQNFLKTQNKTLNLILNLK